MTPEAESRRAQFSRKGARYMSDPNIAENGRATSVIVGYLVCPYYCGSRWFPNVSTLYKADRLLPPPTNQRSTARTYKGFQGVG